VKSPSRFYPFILGPNHRYTPLGRLGDWSACQRHSGKIEGLQRTSGRLKGRFTGCHAVDLLRCNSLLVSLIHRRPLAGPKVCKGLYVLATSRHKTTEIQGKKSQTAVILYGIPEFSSLSAVLYYGLSY